MVLSHLLLTTGLKTNRLVFRILVLQTKKLRITGVKVGSQIRLSAETESSGQRKGGADTPGRWAFKQLCTVTSLQICAVCQWTLAPAWPTFPAGGIIKKPTSVPDSSMVVAMGTITTSHLKPSARSSAKKYVSPKLPCLSGSHKNLDIGPFQDLVGLKLTETAPIRI